MAEQMWRVVAVFRVVTLAYAAVLIIRDHHSYAHPAAGFWALAVMCVWTAITIAAYSRPRGRQPWLICADVAVDHAARREAAIAERERIARGIHDSVLQVLALVSSRGRELGGEAAELARLAGEQETALRSLVSGAPADRPGDGLLDVGGLLEPLGSSRVTVSCPAGAVLLADKPARALAGAAGEALDNVRRHAGADARAWVLVEDDGAMVTVSIRDDGQGFAQGRLAEAAAAGRLGVAQSIVGRLRDVGGKACLTSSPGKGTEVELRVARG